jgi:hypothetical protein
LHLTVETYLVWGDAPGLKPADDHERKVMIFNLEGLRGAAEHLDGTRPIGLDPDRRFGLGHMAQDRT